MGDSPEARDSPRAQPDIFAYHKISIWQCSPGLPWLTLRKTCEHYKKCNCSATSNIKTWTPDQVRGDG